MVSIQVTVTGGEALLATDGAALIQRIGQELAQRMAEATHAATAPLVPVDQGALLASGAVVPLSNGAMLQYTAPYAAGVEHGTPPHEVPISELQGWSDRHNIPAWLVQRAIADHGTKPQPYMAPGLAAASEGFAQMAGDAGAAVRAALTGGA